MKMDRDQIEEISVIAIRQNVARYNRLSADIPTNDKTPSWDGELWVYNIPGKLKEHFYGKVPIQVKGTQTNKLSERRRSFDLNKVDLNNYLLEGGVIFFVVEMLDPDTTKIFFRVLLPIDIREILGEMKNQKTIRKTFQELPDGKLDQICRNFIHHKRKQSYELIMNPSYTGYEQLTGVVIAKSMTDMNDYLLEFGTYIYANVGSNNIDIPLYKVDVPAIFEEDELNIGTNNTIYYTKIIRKIEKDGRTVQFGKGFTISFLKEGYFNIDFKEKGTIEERIMDCKFLLEAAKSKKIIINSSIIHLNFSKAKKEKLLNEMPKYINELEKVLATFNKLGIHLKNDFLELKSDFNKVKMLTDIIINKQYDNKLLKKDRFLLFRIIDLKILIARGVGNYDNELFDFFDYTEIEDKYRVIVANPDKTERTEHSPYLLIDVKELFSCSNLRIESIEKSLLNVNYSNKLSFEVTNLFLLEVLTYYDTQNKINGLLDMAYNIFKHLEELTEDNLIYFINKMQVVKRMRNFTQEEKRQLVDLKNKNNHSNDLMCAFHILLGNEIEFDLLFNDLTAEERESFKTYPIYNLLIDTSNI